MHAVNHHDYLRLSYRPDLQLLFMRWVRPVSSEEHRSGYAAALELAQPHQSNHWLIDLRSRGLASVEDLMWVLTTFRGLLQQSGLPAPRRLAYLVTPYQAETMDERLLTLEPTIAEHIRRGADVHHFTEELPAQDWLRRSS
ncbi:hypothetical protein [Solirubrum puertoriconensis]|nr:hypothetical protein [Solirubrum puertoriconensis]